MTRNQRIATLILGFWIATCIPAKSQESWIEWKMSNGGNGHWYALTDQMTWSATEARGVKLGGHLASIASKIEDDFVRWTVCGGMPAFVGLPLSSATWTDGSPTSYTAFNPQVINSGLTRINSSSGSFHWTGVSSFGRQRAVMERESTPYWGSPSILGTISGVVSNMSGNALEPAEFDVSAETPTDAGNQVVLKVDAFGELPLEFQWRFDGVSLAGATNQYLVLTNVQPTSGLYSIAVANSLGTNEGGGFQLHVRPKIETPSVTWFQWPTNYGGNGHWYGVSGVSQTNSAAIDLATFWNGSLATFDDTNELRFAVQITTSAFPAVGYNLGLRIGLSAAPGAFYRWPDGSAVGDELPSIKGTINTNQSLAGYALSASGGLQTWVGETTFKDSLFELATNPTNLPPYIVHPPAGGAFVSPSTLASITPSFSVFAVGAGPLRCQWKVGGVELLGATNMGLSLPLSTVSTCAVTVVVANANGSVESGPAQIDVVPGVESYAISWLQWPSALGGNDHWYGHVSVSSGLSWSNAQAVAEGLGGDLISFSSENEARHFWNLGSSGSQYGFWLGITDRSDEGVFRSVDGTSLIDFPWADNQPDESDTNADFVYAVSTGNPEHPYRWFATTNDLPLSLLIVERSTYPKDLAPVVLPLAQNLHLATERELNLGVDLIGDGAAELQWRLNGAPIPDATNQFYYLQQALLTDSGIYELIATGSHGSFTSAPVSVTVSIPEPIRLSIRHLSPPDDWPSNWFYNHFAVTYDFPIDAIHVGFEVSSNLIHWNLLTTQSWQSALVEPLFINLPAEKTNVFIRAFKIQ